MVVQAGYTFDNPTLLGLFYESLSDEVKDELVKQKRPAALHEYFQLAIDIDDRLFQRRQERRDRPNNFPRQTPSTSTSTSTSTTTTGVAPMDLSATASTSVNRTRLPDAERQRRFQENLCLYCGQAGHRRNDCPVLAANNKAGNEQARQ